MGSLPHPDYRHPFVLIRSVELTPKSPVGQAFNLGPPQALEKEPGAASLAECNP
ncbi:MAG: hypothetical protein IIC88_07290 [Chloroflexi bacterium]|nr:hypothetical protein [Chloroflexota bacterium]